jgi:hypothetical protein
MSYFRIVMLNVVMLSVFMLSVVMLSVVMLNVVMLSVMEPCKVLRHEKNVIKFICVAYKF